MTLHITCLTGGGKKVVNICYWQLEQWTNGLMDHWTNGPMDPWTNGPMDQWTNANGPMDQQTNEPMAKKLLRPFEKKNTQGHWAIGSFEHLNI